MLPKKQPTFFEMRKSPEKNPLTSLQRDFFETMAERYQSSAILVPGASRFRNVIIDKIMRKALTPILNQLKNLTILEIGCGIGRWTKILSAKNSTVAVDISNSMIRMAKKTCGDKPCSFVVAEASHLPFKKNTFDLVITVTVLQHILNENEHLKALSEIARCDRSTAIIVEEMWSKHETVLQNVYCPTRIVPITSYVKGLHSVGLHTHNVFGLTPAVLTIRLTNLLASQRLISQKNFTKRVRSSYIISHVIHLAMGISMLPSILVQNGTHSPSLSLHTILIAKKESNERGIQF